MIVRDSAATIRPCLAGIRPWVDEVIVVDTGSVDDTPDIVREYDVRLFHFPWCDDFSSARNESLRHASGEWLFWMDSDDTIDEANGRKLRQIVDGPHSPRTLAYVAQVHCPGDDEGLTIVDHVKLFRNHPDLRFEFCIHEQLLPSIRRLGGEVAWSDVFVVHSGSDTSHAGRERKCQRDLRILGKELEERPDHPFALFNVGMTQAEMDRFDLAETALRRCLEVSEDGASHVRKAHALLVMCLWRGRRLEEAAIASQTALALFPHDAELQFRHGVLAHDLGDLPAAENAYRVALRVPATREFSSLDPGIKGYKARHNLALVLDAAGRPDLAEIQWREALREQPTHAPSQRGLLELLLRRGRIAAAGLEWAWLERPDPAWHVGFEVRLLIASGQFAAAERRLAELQEALDEPQRLTLRSQLLLQQGDFTGALPLLELLVATEPDDPSALHNLGSAFAQLGRHNEAELALEESLRLRPNALTEQVLASVRSQLQAAGAS